MYKDINTFTQLLNICRDKNKKIYEIAQEKAAIDLDITTDQVRNLAEKSLYAMKEAIKTGLTNKELSMSEMCGMDCQKLQKKYQITSSMFGKVYEKILIYALATSEENIRMGKIVACPTAGSCGILPSVLCAISEEFNYTQRQQINALITAGEIGRIISNKLALAGAVGGCQAECGVASAMAAAAICQLKDATSAATINSVALAIKNILGLTCDPVAGLVEVPCVKRNPFLAIHAVTASELAMAGIESQIPIDEVIDALEQTASLMSPMLKESSQAGLASTPTALKIKNKIFGK